MNSGLVATGERLKRMETENRCSITDDANRDKYSFREDR